jgi:hypothetical protein
MGGGFAAIGQSKRQKKLHSHRFFSTVTETESNFPFDQSTMPNVHASDHRVISFYIPRELYTLVRKAAHKQGMTITDFVETILYRETKSVTLNPSDYEQIAREIREVESKRKAGGGRKTVQSRNVRSVSSRRNKKASS